MVVTAGSDNASNKRIVTIVEDANDACIDEGASRSIDACINSLRDTGLDTVAEFISDVEYTLGA